ncbi:MAG TPA: hypothetical protein P5026_10765 [Kiritimatiellia bacterium]|nr:hypothetical protein [Kiritimatiellia bacterium]HRU71388.1 hypothetical protein [Kiritimatiellia bacterium]
MATVYYTLKPGSVRTFLLGVARRPGELVAVPPVETLGVYDRQALEAHLSALAVMRRTRATVMRR